MSERTDTEASSDGDREADPVRPSPVRTVGRWSLSALRHAGRAGLLLVASVKALGQPRLYVGETMRQAKRLGVDSVPLVLLIAAMGGSVLAQQSGYQLTTLPAAMVVGEAVAGGLMSEMAPVLTAIVLAGRVGAGVGAELGTMKVTDQIDALLSVGRDPVVELVVPRILAGVLALVPLVIMANAMGLISGWVTSISLLPMNTADYVNGVRRYYHTAALLFSLMKGLVFGFTLMFVSSYVGLQAHGGAKGVGRTATRAVVAVLVAVMALDVVMAPLYKALK